MEFAIGDRVQILDRWSIPRLGLWTGIRKATNEHRVLTFDGVMHFVAICTLVESYEQPCRGDCDEGHGPCDECAVPVAGLVLPCPGEDQRDNEFLKNTVECVFDEDLVTSDGRPAVPCPTCTRIGDFSKMGGTAVEKVVWENYPPPYDVLKKST